MTLLPEEWQRFERLAAGFGARDSVVPAGVVTVQQVHGAGVVSCDDLPAGAHPEIKADALVVTRPGVVVGVKTADCVPILLMSPHTPGDTGCWAAAVHAGWRGSAAGVIAAAVENAARCGHAPGKLCAAIGPSIGPCCYEVGQDVADTFRRLGLPVVERPHKPHLDLAEIAGALLMRAGLVAANVSRSAPCTRCHPERYHSYRANGPGAGRQVSWVGWLAP